MENAVKLPDMQNTKFPHPSKYAAWKPHTDLLLWFMINPDQLRAAPWTLRHKWLTEELNTDALWEANPMDSNTHVYVCFPQNKNFIKG